jgi:hypothetical protein
MTMENTAIDIDRVLEDDEQSTTENTRMRPYLDIWDVSTHFYMVICSWVKFSAHLTYHKTPPPPSRRYKTVVLDGKNICDFSQLLVFV